MIYRLNFLNAEWHNARNYLEYALYINILYKYTCIKYDDISVLNIVTPNIHYILIYYAEHQRFR